MTDREFYKAVRTSMRSDIQENFINKIVDSDIKLGAKLMMSKVNNFKPMTGFVLEDLLEDQNEIIWLDTMICGTIHYILNMQISEWMHNGIDISIDQLDIKDKMSEYQSVSDRCKEEFLESFVDISLPHDLFDRNKTFLQYADLIKFAKYIPDQQEIERLKEWSVDFVEQTKIVCRALIAKKKLSQSKFIVYQDRPAEGGKQDPIFKRFYWWQEECVNGMKDKFGIVVEKRSFKELGKKAKEIPDTEAEEDRRRVPPARDAVSGLLQPERRHVPRVPAKGFGEPEPAQRAGAADQPGPILRGCLFLCFDGRFRERRAHHCPSPGCEGSCDRGARQLEPSDPLAPERGDPGD